MSWIATIPFEAATGKLRALYDRITGPDNNVDNIMMAHSLRPHSMEGHMALYKNVLHHTGNTIPKSVLELIGVRVSALNRCSYCVDHHAAGLRRLLADDARSDAVLEAVLTTGVYEGVLDASIRQMLAYADLLTQSPQDVTEADIRRAAQGRSGRWPDIGGQPGRCLFRLCQPHRAGPRLLDPR